MSPDSMELEAFFTPQDNSHPELGLGSDYHDEVKDFTQFFEKLAAIDDMPWFMEEAQNAGFSGAAMPDLAQHARKAASQSSRPVSPTVPNPAQAPNVTLYHSHGEVVTKKVGFFFLVGFHHYSNSGF